MCDEYQLQLSPFYEWQRKLMENAVVVRALEEQIVRLEAKLARKDSMMAELLSEYVAALTTDRGSNGPRAG